jgi:hypothetical protein
MGRRVIFKRFLLRNPEGKRSAEDIDVEER